MMNRIDAYDAYTADRNFRNIANALGFTGFDYVPEDNDFEERLENDNELGDLLEQLEDVVSSQFLIYTSTTTEFYKRHEYDILDYLSVYGYKDGDDVNYGYDDILQSIENIMCSRVTAYVTGVLSEYGY